MVISDDHVTIASNTRDHHLSPLHLTLSRVKPPQYLSQIWWVPSTCIINRPIKVANYPSY